MIDRARKIIEWSPDFGSEITHCIAKARLSAHHAEGRAALCGYGEPEVVFKFNGVTVHVCRNSDEALIHRDWQRAMSGYLGKNAHVGPYPAAELSDEEKQRDAEIEAENEKRREERRREWKREEEAKRAAFQRAIENAPPLEIIDKPLWQSWVDANESDYGKRTLQYAEEWGRLMQWQIANGGTVLGCAKEMSCLADYDGITGFMQSMARKCLEQVWVHGDELKKWKW